MTRISYAASLALSAAILASSALPAAAATEQVLYSFKSPALGSPQGRLVLLNGSLFGTASGGNGYAGNGQVFKLTNSGGSWKLGSLVKFAGSDGDDPQAGLIRYFDIFYGTTQLGDAYGLGNVFAVWKSGTAWLHGTVWSFGNGGDGSEPTCNLVADSSGNLYGTTESGGTNGLGIVFELIPSGSGYYTEAVLHTFSGGSDGSYPHAGLLRDKNGNLFGTTENSGGSGCSGEGCGTVFELSPNGGAWTYKVLYSFTGGSDGSEPVSALIEGSGGNLYGTTYGNADGFGNGWGSVFELTHSGGIWSEKTLYTFTGGSDGAWPSAALAWDGGNGLYGTASGGGASGWGDVFHLTQSGGVWSEAVLYSFGGSSGDGIQPDGAIILDKSRNLYGTTPWGGAYGNGTVWEITP